MLETSVLVCVYNITQTKKYNGLFSKERDAKVKEGWRMRGTIQSHSQIERYGSEIKVWVTLIQDFEREIP